jgi:hypothetical protein
MKLDTIKQANKSNWKTHASCALITLIVVILLVPRWGADEYRRRIEDLQSEITDKISNLSFSRAIEKDEGKAPDVAGMTTNLAEIRAKLEILNDANPTQDLKMVDLSDRASVQSLLGDLLENAKKNKLVFVSSGAGQDGKRGTFFENRESQILNFNGGYVSLYNFLSSFDELPYSILIVALDLQSNASKSLLEIELHIVI